MPDENEGCLGHKISCGTWGDDYDCDYEFAGRISCEDCIFGYCGGTEDPRINPEDDE
ncbi:MAG: hypothetical protein PHG66_06770 [Candidatus Colwellbacteria bacterium]|nr:hypothetical protein [Candidatus Colwellbacteria bacterium]